MNSGEQFNKDKRTKTITVSRVFDTTIEAAFDAWTKPESLAKWFGPKGYSANILTHELRAGGKWRFFMARSKNEGFHHFGSFVEITAPTLLKFTWASEEQIDGWRNEDGNPTLVTVRIQAHGDGVKVSITHEELQSHEVRQALTFGWEGGLKKLTKLLES